MDTNEVCASCRWAFKVWSKGDRFLGRHSNMQNEREFDAFECRRFPPSPSRESDPQPLAPDYWCGEWQASEFQKEPQP